MTFIRVLIVDDSVTMRAMLEQVISTKRDFQVVGVAADAVAAKTLMANCRPDLMTLDLTMPGIDGLQFLRTINDQRHPPIIVVSSASTPDACISKQALEAGAAACFDKASLLANIPAFLRKLSKAAQSKPGRAIRVVSRGDGGGILTVVGA